MNREVVVSGMGMISPFGYGIDYFLEALQKGKSSISFVQEKTDLPISVASIIEDFSFENLLLQKVNKDEKLFKDCKKIGRRLPFSLQCSLLSVLEAWKHARLEEKNYNNKKIGLVVGGSNLSRNYMYEQHNKFQDNMSFVTPSYALHFMDTDHVGVISDVFGITGEGFTVGGASASGNVALIKAMQMIQHGIVDICVVVGTLTDLSPMELNAFYNLGAIGGKRFANSHNEACRPFDKDHEGFIYGQASGCIILERKEVAIQRGITSYAKMLSGAIKLDGNRLADPNIEGEKEVMKDVLEKANLSINDVNYINTHGTSTPLGDKTEINAIKQVFGNKVSNIYINSTKSILGHCLYSAGVVEAIATVLQVYHDFVHPNLNLLNPICNQCKFTKKLEEKANVNVAISNAFGFGGINTSILIRKEDEK
ncbi:MAG: hypothetical protein N4A50_13185 [Vallitalea sp.]|jgi:malonyl-ACP decarboxylase|nr:hypothetical protein [Vallitalea sp.]